MTPCCRSPSTRSRTLPRCPPRSPCIWTPAMTTGPAGRPSTSAACTARSPIAGRRRRSRSAGAGSSSGPTPGSTTSASCAAAPSAAATASMPTSPLPPRSSPSVPCFGPPGTAIAGALDRDHHASADLLADALSTGPLQHRPDGLPEDHEVERQRPVLDVADVDPHRVVPREVGPAADLPEPGEARLDQEAAMHVVAVLLHLGLQRRPRADQRHVPAQHVDQLRQLVD